MRKTRSSNSNPPPYDPDFEKKLKKKKKDKKNKGSPSKIDFVIDLEIEDMVAQRLMDYAAPWYDGLTDGVRRPQINADHFEIKPALLQMIQNNVQFFGMPSENPTTHLSTFLELCDTFKMHNVSLEAIRLRLFPFRLKDKAKAWLNSLPANSITTWDALARAFLSKYFPLAKTAKIIKEITSFTQHETETVYEVWERYKELQRVCPHYNLANELLMQTFYNGVSHNTRSQIDAMSGGCFMKKTSAEAFELLEEMAGNSCMWPVERAQVTMRNANSSPQSSSASCKGIIELDPLTKIEAQFSKLSNKIDQLQEEIRTPRPEDCERPNVEDVSYVQGQTRNNPYSSTYNPGWRNHPNFGWRDNVNSNQDRPTSSNAQYQSNNQSQPRSQHSPLSELSSKIDKFIDGIGGKMSNQDKNFKRIETKFDQLLKNHSSSIHNLEVQIGQLAKSIPSRKLGDLPSNTESNPKEQVKAITLRSGTRYDGPSMPSIVSNILEDENVIKEVARA
ncbi:hypothetical protein M5689_003284 [Euphorbia peplus]|nr:hypothetical protein M5689_003284 [Euphorbia peplus]